MSPKAPKTIAILGATSAVAQAFARLTCDRGTTRFLLLGRDQAQMTEILADLIARGAAKDSLCIVGEIGNPDQVSALFENCSSKGPIDEVLIAYGMLGDQYETQANSAAIEMLLDVNLVSTLMWCEAFASHFEQFGVGKLAIIGSVAGDRGRQSNYLYGATKAALECACEGMAHRFAGSDTIGITFVKPGFIDTPMTDHLNKSGPLWASPSKVARIIRNAMEARRTKVYAPWFWRWIMLIIRALPVPIMHRTKL
ncbi:MAG: SDR family NAD(P)-dependent oxidoreductase [Pseudomonadota bacterium]